MGSAQSVGQSIVNLILDGLKWLGLRIGNVFAAFGWCPSFLYCTLHFQSPVARQPGDELASVFECTHTIRTAFGD